MRCSRPDCNAAAAALVAFEPGRRIAHLMAVDAVGGWAVCRRHAETLVVPRRWVLVDDRPEAPALFVLPDAPAADEHAAAAVETVTLWNGHFAPVDATDDLGGVLDARTPLLRRAFRAARAG